MNAWSILVRLVPILAIVGLVMAPLGATASPHMPQASMTADAGAPCCPETPDCDKACCPAVCASPAFQHTSPSAQAWLPRVAFADLIRPGDDARRADLSDAPIPTPPRA